MKNQIKKELVKQFSNDLVDALLNAYLKSLAEYRKGNWQYCINEIGQFIEIVRRLIISQLERRNCPLTEKLSIFSQEELKRLESFSKANEEYRIIIPRVLFMMACLRNKRGAIHPGSINPNKMDARLLLIGAKWIVAELFRLNSKISEHETSDIIEAIVSVEIPLLWNINGKTRVLNTKMLVKDKILCLLYGKSMKEKELRDNIEYQNVTMFKKILKKLHAERLLEYSDDTVMLSPLGQKKAEELLK